MSSDLDQPRDGMGRFAGKLGCDCGHTAVEHDLSGDLACLVPECECEEYLESDSGEMELGELTL